MEEASKVKFQYLGQEIIVQCKGNKKMKDIGNRFKSKIQLKSNNLIFLCHGINLNLEKTFNEEVKDDDKKNNEMTVIVHEGISPLNNSLNKVMTKSKDIICPICKENCRMCIINYKIILYGCKNGHKTNNIFLEDFNNTQLINESSIICDDCHNENKGSCFKKQFFKCLTCKKNLGILCNEKHKKEDHMTIDYDKKDYICEVHNDFYISYCKECRLNLCMTCYSEHNNNHNKIDYRIIFPKKSKINEKIIELRNKIDKIKIFITDIIEKLKKVMEKMDIFYQINYNILNDNKLQNKNYQILQNINEISNNIEISNVDKIINEENISNKISELLKVFDKMVNKEENHDVIHKEEIDNIPNNINSYKNMRQETICNANQKNNFISPIFSGNKIIRNCNKYTCNYTNCINYNDYLSNDNLIKVLKLYFFYNKLLEKINQKNSFEEKYYLVNKEFMNNIKKDYNYNELNILLKNSGINENNKDKIILSIIKNQNANFIKNFFGKDNSNNEYKEEYMDPDIFPLEFKINDQKTQIMIYENFEIISKDIIELFLGKINENINNYLTCTLQESKIIICFPQRLGNNFFISLLGKLNNENTFINEYILIYKKSSSQSNHKKIITNSIVKFINELQMNMFNNSTPIIDKNYIEVGLAIKFDNNIKGSIMNWTIEKIQNYNNYDNPNLKQEMKNIEPSNNHGKNNENINVLTTNYKDSLKKYFDFPPLIGLQNIGATCYMNATLQCFCHIDKFVCNFKYSQHIIDIANKDNKSLTYSFIKLIEKIWPNNYNDPFFNEKIFAPEEFKEKISKMNPLFKGIASNDAKDLVNFIIMTLHKELNIKPYNLNKNNNVFLDQRNQAIMLKNFIEEFKSNDRSIISDLFYAMNCNRIQCRSCNTQIYNYQIYFFLEFPLEEIHKFKYNNYQYNYNNNFISNEVNIYDCFEYDRKVNLMSGGNSKYCNYCQRNSNYLMCTSLVTGPEILIILLRRSEINIMINSICEIEK